MTKNCQKCTGNSSFKAFDTEKYIRDECFKCGRNNNSIHDNNIKGRCSCFMRNKPFIGHMGSIQHGPNPPCHHPHNDHGHTGQHGHTGHHGYDGYYEHHGHDGCGSHNRHDGYRGEDWRHGCDWNKGHDGHNGHDGHHRR